MRNLLTAVSLAIVSLLGTSVSAQTIERGTVKSVDADKGKITITVDGKDRELEVGEKTQIRTGGGGELEGGLKNEAFKAGASVFFATRTRDGKTELIGLRPASGNEPGGNRPNERRPNAGGDIQRGRIKSLDLEKKTLTLTVDGKDRELTVPDNVQVLGGNGDSLAERMKDFKVGLETQFREENRNGKPTAIALRLVREGDRPAGRNAPPPPPADLKPLTDLGSAEYHGFQGGLYPEGKNTRPQAHEAAGLRLAAQVQPLDRDGKPARDGCIVLMSVGMSNTSQASNGFSRALSGEAKRNPPIQFIDGAQGGMTAFAIQNPDDGRTGTRYWTTVDDRLKAAGVTREQVQVIWIKQADAGPSSGFPNYARTLEGELTKIVQLLPKRFPNVKLCYLSSRTYGGYATTGLNPEPYAFESGFSVKWLIERQIKGEADLNFDSSKGQVRAPWLSWGPYLWANGSQPRSDGFRYERSDFAENDGTHHTGNGSTKIGRLMLDFFKSDSTSKPWFLMVE